MNISGVSGIERNNNQMGAGMAEDAETKNIKNEIARVQKKIQDLAANEDISLEEKMKRRQELQKQLTELNSQLRQHQMEQRKKASEAEKKQQENEFDSMGGKNCKKQSEPAAEVILTADAALKQAKVQDKVITKQKGRAGVLESEIQMDSSRGRNVEAKQEELANVEARMAETRSSQMEDLNRANKAIKEGKEDEGAPKAEEKEEEKVGAKTADSAVKLDAKKTEEEERNAVSLEDAEPGREESLYRPINILL